MHKNSFTFTKEALDALQPSSKRQYFRDAKQSGLGAALMPSGTLSFQVIATIDGKTARIPIGKYNQHTKLEAIRKHCRDVLTEIDKGKNPVEAKREKRAQEKQEKIEGITVKDAVETYLKEKRTGKQKLELKESTKDSYRDKIGRLLGDHYEKPLTDITEELIAEKLRKTAKAQGATGARSLSAVWNWTRKQKAYRRLMGENPIKLYSEDHDGLYVAPKRTGFIRKEYLADWFDATDEEKHGECMVWLLLTGNRLEEARGLKWPDLDFKTGLYTLRDPKNRHDVELPIPAYLVDSLKARKKRSGRVFTMPAQNARIRGNISKAAGLPHRFTNHDLRRTFGTIGRTVCDHIMVKQLMNHLVSDITFDYSQLDGSDLAPQLRKVEAAILGHAGRELPAAENVVRMRAVS